MTRSFVALWTTLGVAILSLCVLAQFWVNQRASMAQQRVESILQSQLEPINDSILSVLEGYSFELQGELAEVELANLSHCVDLKRHYLADAVIVANSNSQLGFPVEIYRESPDKQSLIDEAMQLLSEHINVQTKGQNPNTAGQIVLNNAQNGGSNVSPAQQATPATSGSDVKQSKVYYGNRSGDGNRSSDENRSSFPDAYATQSAQMDPFGYGAQELDSATEQQSQTVEMESQQQNQGLIQQLAQANVPMQTNAPMQGNSPLQSSGDASAFVNQQQANNFSQQRLALPSEPDFGWVTWYHRRNMVIGFWWQQADGMRVMIALPTARWMADIVASLPDTEPLLQNLQGNENLPSLGSVNQLVDVEGQVIYQWGDAPKSFWATAKTLPPSAEISVGEPLEGWRLRVVATEGLFRQLAGDTMVLPIWLAVGGMSLALFVCGLLVSINLNRQLRLAKSRVSFVNQVSHELRTPLTNICMYADLLANEIDSGDSGETVDRGFESGAQSNSQLARLEVIQSESRRLNRLIGNVLEFARSEGKSKPLRFGQYVMDQLVEEVLETFLPKLKELGFEIEKDLDARCPRNLDPDAVEQILVNLIGNAEKYAISGGWIRISTLGCDEKVEIRVQDRGPGVPAKMSEKIFSPFERISDRLEDPAGTGIGLTIVRELARKHGGDCRLESSSGGASFHCILHAPKIAEDDS
ncbi:MAG: HAMP domain-containing sensor histidine kinase [Planctomycetota bacterium]